MLARMTSAFGGGGGGGGMGLGGAFMGVQVELQQLKSAPVLNPHFHMVDKYLDCLNRLMDALITTQGPAMGVKTWLIEVQTLTRLVQKRAFQRLPLTPQERMAILNFANYWRQNVSAPYFMGRPEAQIVLIALSELATR
ncbi:hypothetical protein BCR39DRAFT_503750 [Naematelia encephala]|uniref:Uncharacterized protein n=1 Tax=Naematelia encephala TaxID=71784 RepID=A0A1Y2BH63_9TREE|nr:hypothetical protein BCR39DRAFT_503750 [Naematelia encephala]